MLKIDDYKKLAKDKKVICNWVCAVLMLVLLIMQFMPYWNFDVEIPVYKKVVDMKQFEVADDATEEGAEAAEVKKEEVKEAEPAEGEGLVVEEEVLPYVECPHCKGLIVRDNPETAVILVDEIDVIKTETRSVSINDYVWMPFNHEACEADGISDPANDKVGMSGLENFLNSKLDKPVEIENVLRMPIAYLIIAILGLLLAISNPKKLAVPVFAVLGGAVAVLGYVMEPVFALSSNWMIHVVVSALLVVAGLGTIIFRIVKREPKDA